MEWRVSQSRVCTFRVWGLEGAGLEGLVRVECLGFRVQGLEGFGLEGKGYPKVSLGFKVWG